MVRCYIALGSNLDNPLLQVQKATKALTQLPFSTFIAASPWYQTKAIGPGKQPDYINGVVCLDTTATAKQLLQQLQEIENQQQRIRTERWGPRTLDLDILLYGNHIINDPSLQIPHPRLKERAFVVQPLFDIAPQLQLPDGSSLHSLLYSLSNNDIEQLELNNHDDYCDKHHLNDHILQDNK